MSSPIAPSVRALELLGSYEAGWSLPQPFYVDDEFYALDVEHVLVPSWLFVTHDCEVPNPGDWVRIDLFDDSIIVVRGNDGEVRSFFNTCRHRGSIVCLDQAGHSRRLVCPYHKWTYNLDGSFAGARYLPDDFEAELFGLSPVHCETIGGYVFVCLADDAPDISAFAGAAEQFLAPHGLQDVKVAHTETIIEHANWKLVMENNRECYHCGHAHPELMQTIDEFDGPGSSRHNDKFLAILEKKLTGWNSDGIVHEQTTEGGLEWRLVRIPFTNDGVAMTIDGSPASNKILGTLRESQRDLGSVRMLHFPNTWNHVQSDHVVSFSLLPLSADETELTTRWLVHKDAVQGVDYDLDHLTKVWVATNGQDRILVENNHRGIGSRGYRPGPYAPGIETGTADFTSWYTTMLHKGLTG